MIVAHILQLVEILPNVNLGIFMINQELEQDFQILDLIMPFTLQLSLFFPYPIYTGQVAIYHSINHQIDLKSQLQSMMTFLTQHPNEFIIMLLAQENGHNEAQSLNRIMGLFESLKFPYYMSKQIPQVGQLRGKVWIMLISASFPGMNQNTFVFQNSQTYYQQYPKYYLQNHCDAGIDQKVRCTKQLISKSCVSNKLKLNWLNKAYNGRFHMSLLDRMAEKMKVLKDILKIIEEILKQSRSA